MRHFFTTLVADAKKIPTGVKLLVLVIFFRALGWGVVDPFFSVWLSGFTDSYKLTGLLMSFYSLVSLFSVIPLIRLVDSVQDSKIVEDGDIFYLFTILFYIAAGVLHNLPLLVIALLLNGIAHPLVFVGVESYIRKHTLESGSAQTFGFYIGLNYFGWILGMIIGSFAIQHFSITLLFACVLPSIILGFFVFPRIHERGYRSLFSAFFRLFHRPSFLNRIYEDYKHMNRRISFLMFLAFFDGVIVMFSYVFIPLFAVTVDVPLPKVALLMATMHIPFVFSFLITELTDRYSKMDVIAGGLFVGSVAFILLSFIVVQHWVVLLSAMTMLSLAIVRPAYNGMITHLTPRRMMGEVTGMNNLAQRLGFVVGPFFSGIIADAYGIQFTFFVIALFTFILAAITFLLRDYTNVSTPLTTPLLVHEK